MKVNGQGVYTLKDNMLSFLQGTEPLGDENVHAMMNYDTGKLLLGEEKSGLLLFDNKTHKLESFSGKHQK